MRVVVQTVHLGAVGAEAHIDHHVCDAVALSVRRGIILVLGGHSQIGTGTINREVAAGQQNALTWRCMVNAKQRRLPQSLNSGELRWHDSASPLRRRSLIPVRADRLSVTGPPAPSQTHKSPLVHLGEQLLSGSQQIRS